MADEGMHHVHFGGATEHVARKYSFEVIVTSSTLVKEECMEYLANVLNEHNIERQRVGFRPDMYVVEERVREAARHGQGSTQQGVQGAEGQATDDPQTT